VCGAKEAANAMKTLLTTFAFVLVFAITGISQTPEFVTAKAGKQVAAKKSKLKIKFVSVVEDSRCPEGVNCIWAGNAKIKVLIDNGTTKQEFEMNTNTGPKGDSFSGWAIYLEELTPYPKEGSSMVAKLYKAKFKIVRLTR
jgi:hypothetical protein